MKLDILIYGNFFLPHRAPVQLLLDNKDEYDKMAKAVNPYGNGKSSKMIYDYLINP